MAVGKLREVLVENSDKDNVYTRAANGSLPIVVHVENKVLQRTCFTYT